MIMVMSYGDSRNNNPEWGTLPHEGIRTLTQCWGLCDQMILRTMLAVALLRVRSSHARQVNGDDLDKTGYPGAPGWGLGVGLQPHPLNLICYETSTTASERESKDYKDRAKKFGFGTRNIRTMLIGSCVYTHF